MSEPTQTSSDKETVSSGSRRWTKIFNWIREITAITFWIFVFTKVFVIDIDQVIASRFFPGWVAILEYKFFVVLMLLAMIASLEGRLFRRKALAYVLFYPFVVLLYHFPRVLLPRWELTFIFYPTIHNFFRTFRSNFIWIALVVNAGLVILLVNQKYFQYAASLLLLFYLARHFWKIIQRAFAPTRGLLDIKSLVIALNDFCVDRIVDEEHKKLEEFKGDSSELDKQIEGNLKRAYIAGHSLQLLAIRIKRIIQTRMITLYNIFSVLCTFILTGIIFSFVYFAAFNIDSSSWSNTGSGNFGSFVGYSFSTLFTSSISKVEPVKNLPIILSYFECFCTFFLLAIVISFVVGADQDRTIAELEEVNDELAKGVERLNTAIEERYQHSPETLEDFLIDHSADTVRSMRKFCGLDVHPKLAKKNVKPDSSDDTTP